MIVKGIKTERQTERQIDRKIDILGRMKIMVDKNYKFLRHTSWVIISATRRSRNIKILLCLSAPDQKSLIK